MGLLSDMLNKKQKIKFGKPNVGWKIGKKTGMFDFDRDGVLDKFDCQPFDKRRQDARMNEDIGMYTIDRPRTSCLHATPFCAKTCYNIKMYKSFMGKGIRKKDVRNEADWKNWSGLDWHNELITKSTKGKKGGLRRIPKSIKRVRLMSRGEAFSTDKDIDRVKDMIRNNPQSVFWIPTRAWHNPHLKRRIESEIERYPNVRVLWSTDPSDFRTGEYSKTRGHSTMFYGDDSLADKLDPLGRRFYKCPKTWQNKKGYCAICTEGCFKRGEVHVHLRQHTSSHKKKAS